LETEDYQVIAGAVSRRPFRFLSKKLQLLLVWQKMDTTIYNLSTAGFNIFLQHFMLLNVGIYFPEAEPEETSDGSLGFCDCNPEIILYLASNQLPKSTSLQRCEQKGKNFASLTCS